MSTTDVTADNSNNNISNGSPRRPTGPVQELPRSQFEELKFLITDGNAQINRRMDTLENRIASDINNLRTEDRRLAGLIETNQEDSAREIANLKRRIDAHDEEFRAQSAALRGSNDQNTLLTEKLINLEKASYSSQQHQRGWNVEIDGIPVNIGDEPGQLQTAAIALFEAINVDIDRNDIDTIHRLPTSRTDEPKPVIIRFRSRKDVRAIHDNKHKLKDLADLRVNMAGLNQDSRIYIRPSQCSYYKNLSYNCRILKRNNMIERVVTGNDGKITIKPLDGPFIKVAHETDLTKKFPRFQRFNFNSGGD